MSRPGSGGQAAPASAGGGGAQRHLTANSSNGGGASSTANAKAHHAPKPAPQQHYQQPPPPTSTPSSQPPVAVSDWGKHVGAEVRVVLQQPDAEIVTGLLWAHDATLATLVLEQPTGTGTPASHHQLPTPSNALSLPPPPPATAAAASGANAPASAAPPPPPKTSFRLIKQRRVKSLHVVAPPASRTSEPPASTTTPNAAAVDVGLARSRERAAVAEAARRWARIGVGVKPEAQRVFDALSKTLPCRWHQTHIIVMDEIVISDPYTTASVPNYSVETLRALSEGRDVAAGASVPADARAKARVWAQVTKVLEGERKRFSGGGGGGGNGSGSGAGSAKPAAVAA